MTIVEKIESQYFEIESDYYSKEFQSRSIGDSAKEEYWKERRELNTHAYFLFLFTRLEDHIRNESDALISDRENTSTDWRLKAIWNIANYKDLHLKKRLALLAQKGFSDYNKIIEYYDYRNIIAHGSSIPDISMEIDMIEVFADMKRYFTNLSR